MLALQLPAWQALLAAAPALEGALMSRVCKFTRALSTASGATSATQVTVSQAPADPGRSWLQFPYADSGHAPPHNKQLNQRINSVRSARELLDLVDTHHQEFNTVNSTSALSQFVRLQHAQRQELPGLPRLLDMVAAREKDLRPRERGSVLRGLAILDLHGSSLLRSIMRHPSQWRDFHPRYVPSVLWSLGKLAHLPPAPVMDILLGHTRAAVRSFDDADVANSLWGLQRLKLHVKGPLLGELLERVRVVLPSAMPMRFTTILYCISIMKLQPDPEIMDAIMGYVQRHGPSFQPAQMAMMLWSLHNLETTPGPGTLNRLYRRACDDFGAYTPQQRAMAVTALGLHTHGELGAPAAEFLERTVHSLRVDLPTFKLKEISAVLNACNNWRFDPGLEVVTAAARQVTDRPVVPGNEQVVRVALLAFASLAQSPPQDVLEALRNQLLPVARRFKTWELTTSMWALALLQALTPEAWNTLLDALQSAIPRESHGAFSTAQDYLDKVDTKNLVQLQHSWLALEQQYPGVHGFKRLEPLMTAAMQAWKQSAQRTHMSDLHQNVSNTLKGMGVDHEVEAMTEDAAFSVDIMVREPRVVLEVEGPSHYTINTHSRTGSAVLRSRLLETRGWQVIPIPYFEWNRVGGSSARHMEYLRSKLPDSVTKGLSEAANQQQTA